MELEHPIIIILYAFDELKVWPFVSLQKSFGRVFIYFCVIIFVFLYLRIYFLCKFKQFLDGVRTSPKYFIVCIRWTKSFTICVFTEWVCQTHWSYAQIIFPNSLAHQDVLNKDVY